MLCALKNMLLHKNKICSKEKAKTNAQNHAQLEWQNCQG